MNDADLEQAVEAFLQESQDLLQSLETDLLAVGEAPPDDEAVNRMFRAVHTIKGTSGLFALEAVIEFTHGVENLMDLLRKRQLVWSKDLIALLLRCKDHIASLLEGWRNGRLAEAARVSADLLREIRPYREAAGAMTPPAPGGEVAVERLAGGEATASSDLWHLSIRLRPELLCEGMDPLSLFDYLARFGEIVHVTTLSEGLPPTASFDPERLYLGFEISFRSSASKQTLEGAFEFVREGSFVGILPPRSKISEYLRLIEELPEDPRRLGEILVEGGAITAYELDSALATQCLQRVQALSEDRPVPRLGEVLMASQAVHAPVLEAALKKQAQVEEKKSHEVKLVKVQAEKLDHHINLIGELVIAAASTRLLADRARDRGLREVTSSLEVLVDQIRDSALQLRMVQIGETFNRFHRIIRDVSQEVGKPIHLNISGADTELDKSMVDKVGDPLVHLVRNAIDHGIESPEIRHARGKPAHGTVSLHARHDSGTIVIEVSDDGGGIERNRVLQKALEKGLIKPEDRLTDRQILALVLEPGFSTAEQVTNLSGRGVGMDVVRRNIEALRGTLEIDSTEGVGTCVRIALPLTLAIIDCFLVAVGEISYVVPLDLVAECIDRPPVMAASDRRHYLNLRGEVLPYIDLRNHFEVSGVAPPKQKIVVTQFGGRKVGLVVDRLLGEIQAVIKPLSKLFGRVMGIAGSTILGSGDVALILDIPTLAQSAGQSEARSLTRHP
ncbi:MAG: chemotaxis protein CheA [Pseudomonadota bacterium]